MADAAGSHVDRRVDAKPKSPSRWWLLALPSSLLFIAAAVALEVAAGGRANSDLPTWAHLMPLAWPPSARVLWWLSVAAAALTFRVGLRKLGMPTHRFADVFTVVPFLAFAAGIGMGADWATWH